MWRALSPSLPGRPAAQGASYARARGVEALLLIRLAIQNIGAYAFGWQGGSATRVNIDSSNAGVDARCNQVPSPTLHLTSMALPTGRAQGILARMQDLATNPSRKPITVQNMDEAKAAAYANDPRTELVILGLSEHAAVTTCGYAFLRCRDIRKWATIPGILAS